MPRLLLITLVVAMLVGVPPASGDDIAPPEAGFTWAEVQPRGGFVAAAGNLDGAPGDELVLSGQGGGLSAVRIDGSILWRRPAVGPVRPTLLPDVDGDACAQVAAGGSACTAPHVALAAGFPGQPGQLLLLSGRTGVALRAWAVHSPVGRPAVGDINGDGAGDLVVPSVDGDTQVLALFGPDFQNGWTATLPGQMDAYYVNAESLDVADIDGDGQAEVLFATRQRNNIGGRVFVLAGRDGSTRWSADTGPTFGVRGAPGTVLAYAWAPAGLGTWQARLLALPAGGGSPRWTYSPPGFIRSGPLAVGDLGGDGRTDVAVAVGAHQQGTAGFGLDPSSQAIHAVDLADGQVRWVHKTGRDVSSLVTVPAAGGGLDLVYGTDAWLSSLGDEDVVLLAGHTGAPRWLHRHAADFGDDGVAGIVAADIDADGQPEVVHGFGQQAVAALSLAGGAPLARRTFPSVWTAAAVGDLDGAGEPEVVGGGIDGLVRAMSVTGQPRWTTAVGGPVAAVAASPAAVLVVTIGAGGRVVALDPGSGLERWSYVHGVTANPFSTHQQAFADLDGDSTPDVVVGGTANERPTLVAVNGRTGSLLWRGLSAVLPPTAAQPTLTGHVVGVGVHGTTVVAALMPAGNLANPVKVAAVDTTNGQFRWAVPAAGSYGADAVVRGLGDTVLVAYADQFVKTFRLADGAVAATADLAGGHAFVQVGDRVAAVATSVLAAADVTVFGAGGVEATVAEGLSSVSGAVLVPGAWVAVAGPSGLHLLDAGELALGRIVRRGEWHLPPSVGPTGGTAEYPSIRQLVAGDGYAVGLSDLQLLNGYGGAAPGAWVALVR